MGNVRFPNEPPEYRAARDALTKAETELTRRIEEVPEQRVSCRPAARFPKTSLLDGLDGVAPDLAQRAGFAVVVKSPIGLLRSYARERGWVNLRLLSSPGNTYDRDYHGENEDEQLSRMNVFTRRGAVIRHFYATEQIPAAPRWDDRHVDLSWPLRNLIAELPQFFRSTGVLEQSAIDVECIQVATAKPSTAAATCATNSPRAASW